MPISAGPPRSTARKRTATATVERYAASRPAVRKIAEPESFRVSISSDVDIVTARQKGRELATRLGFSPSDSTIVSTAISELARNIVRYALRGEITVLFAIADDHPGITVIAQDEGPGITNVQQAMQDGFSTSGGLGLGLPGVKRLTDEFEIVSEVGRGTTITVKKWKR